MQKVSKNSRQSFKKVKTFGKNIHLEKFQPYVLNVQEVQLQTWLQGKENLLEVVANSLKKLSQDDCIVIWDQQIGF